MTAATAAKATPIKKTFFTSTQPVAASTEIFEGTLVAANAGGYAVPADDDSALCVIGLACEDVDNSAGANGAKSIRVADCIARMATSGGSALTQADVGQPAYVLDDSTVVKSAGATNGVEAGKIISFETGYVWLHVGDSNPDLSELALADGAVTFSKAAVFVSAEQTATGSAQNVAHGLGVAPTAVLVSFTEFNGDDGAHDIAEGTHTSTNVVLTVTTGTKFKVLAWA